jgi:hypothetical protein
MVLTGDGVESGHDDTSFLGRLSDDLTTPCLSAGNTVQERYAQA